MPGDLYFSILNVIYYNHHKKYLVVDLNFIFQESLLFRAIIGRLLTGDKMTMKVVIDSSREDFRKSKILKKERVTPIHDRRRIERIENSRFLFQDQNITLRSHVSKHVRANLLKYLCTFLASVLLIGGELVLPQITKHLVDLLTGTHDPSLAQVHLKLGALAGVLILVMFLVRTYRDFMDVQLQAVWTLHLRKSVIKHSLQLPAEKIRQIGGGGVYNLINSNCSLAGGLVFSTIIHPALSILYLASVLFALLLTHLALGFFMIAVILMVVLFTLTILGKTNKYHKEVGVDLSRLSKKNVEIFSQIRTVHLLSTERFESRRLIKSFNLMTRKKVRIQILQIIQNTIWELLIGVLAVMTVWFGYFFVKDGEITVGAIIMFQLYLALIVTPIWKLISSIDSATASVEAARRIVAFLDIKVHSIASGTEPPPESINVISFEDISFSYNNETPLLSGISFSVNGPSVFGIVGGSGSGKTTLIDMLTARLQPTSGSIKINGVDIRSFSREKYRKLFAGMYQGCSLFSGTIYDNIVYGSKNFDDKLIARAAQLAKASDFIEKLPRRYDYEVGEHGSSLSGGQIQRVCLARAYYSSSKILILDEFTSNLDPKTAEDVILTLAAERERLVFLVSHDPNVLKWCDQLVFLRNGSVGGVGSMDELLVKCPEFKEVFEIKGQG